MTDDGNRADTDDAREAEDERGASSFKPLVPPPTRLDGELSDEEPPRVSLGPLSLLGFGPRPSGARLGESIPIRPSVLVAMAALVIVVAGLKIARPILVPLAVSVFLAILTAPFVLYLKRHRVPPTLGVPLVMAAAVVFLSFLMGIIVGTFNTFLGELPAYQERISELLTDGSSYAKAMGYPITLSSLTSLVDPAVAMQLAGDTLSELAELLSNIVLVLLMSVFVLFEVVHLPDKIRNALGDPNADLSQGIRVISRIKAYVVIKTWMSLATGLIIGGALELMGVDFALLWGLLAFLLNFIPNIGSIVAAIPAMVLALLQSGPAGAIATAVVFLVVNMVIGNMLEPRIMGERMDLSPLVVFFCLVFWGWVWGPVGMLLSVPLTMAMRIMLEGHANTRPFAILMAGASPLDQAPRTMRSS